MQFFNEKMLIIAEQLKQNPLFIHSSEAIVLINNQYIIGEFNLAAQKKFKLDSKIKFTHVSNFFDLTKTNSLREEKLSSDETYNKLFWLKNKNGRSFLADVKIIPYDQEHYLLMIDDLSVHNGDSLINKIAEKFISHSREGILITDKEKNIILVNNAFEKATGYTQQEVIHKTPNVLKSGIHDVKFYRVMWDQLRKHGIWSGEIWNRRKNGEIYPEWITICAVYNNDKEITHYIALFIDTSNQKVAEEQLLFLAHHDALTGVANRYSLNAKLANLLEAAKLKNQQLAVLFLDLDRFKHVNDTLGHSFGDLLLKEVSDRLKSLLKPKDLIARFGGDEFVIVLPNIHHPKEAIILANRITTQLSKSFFVNDIEIVVTTSVGISMYPHDGDTIEVLLVNADRAMYEAKANGRNNFKVFHKELDLNVTDKMVKELFLRKALERNELSLHFQPIIYSKNNSITCVEALIRWHQSEIGYVPANELIEIAEETGLIIPISEWIIREACQNLANIHLNSYSSIKMAINISGIVFQQENFIRMVKDIFEQTNIRPKSIVFELTESVIMTNNKETLEKLNDLKEMGVSISIDDFGTGYSSLSYLKSFPIDKLKIDQSFTRGLLKYKEDQNITKAIVNLGHGLDLKIVAEGVEVKEQLQFLLGVNCDYLQGYYFSKPIPLPELIDYLELWEIQQGSKEI